MAQVDGATCAAPTLRTMIRRRRSRRPSPQLHDTHEFSRALALIVDRDELCEAAAVRLQEIFGLERVVVLLRDESDTAFRHVAARGIASALAATATIPVAGRLAQWLRVNEIPLALHENPGAAAFLDDAERSTLTGLGTGICVPLVAMNRLIGILLLGYHGQGAAPTYDPEFLTALAAQIALALENATLLHERRTRLKRLYRAERLATAGELAAGAAHEIRNPLTSIRSAIQYLRGDYPAESDRAMLIDEVLSEVDRIDGIVEGLLSFARPRAARFESIDLAALLRQTVTLISARAEDQGIALELHATGPLPATGDPDLLRQLFLNLFLNALQATPHGGTLRISASTDRRMTMVRITDTGHGIAPENLERIFAPFFTTKGEGTGLGLSIGYGIVERHGGEIEVESEVGRGTTMIVRLPGRNGR